MHLGRTTLSKFLIQQLRGLPHADELAALLVDVAAAVKAVSAMTAKGALGGVLGAVGQQNCQGEEQKKLDVLANDAFIRHCDWNGLVAGMASEENEAPIVVDAAPVETAVGAATTRSPATQAARPPMAAERRGRFLLVFDPLDGSSNTDINAAIGSIFSVLPYVRGGGGDGDGTPTEADFLQPGRAQVAAGYALYGPSTMLVLTVGRGTHGFTLDREIGNFILTHPDLTVPAETAEFAINASNARFWEPPVRRYVAECQAGRAGDRGRDFNMRWVAAFVADVHRILIRGGVYLYPRDHRDPSVPGRLRLLYEAAPMAMVIEQAGGRASTGRGAMLDEVPRSLHARVPVIVGTRAEVERLERYHAEHDRGLAPFDSPLFNERTLYRAGVGY